MRMRISPDIEICLGLRVKQAGERMVGKDVELILTRSGTANLPPYQRLLGDALRGIGQLFAREDFVEAQWRVVAPILGDVAPLDCIRSGHMGTAAGCAARGPGRCVAESDSSGSSADSRRSERPLTALAACVPGQMSLLPSAPHGPPCPSRPRVVRKIWSETALISRRNIRAFRRH